jgi:hypothetical protein
MKHYFRGYSVEKIMENTSSYHHSVVHLHIQGEKVTGYNLYSSSSIIRVTESSRMTRWAGNIACTTDEKFTPNVTMRTWH